MFDNLLINYSLSDVTGVFSSSLLGLSPSMLEEKLM